GLVAVISAYKDLPGPIKELIDWDQQRQEVQVRYDQVVEQFSPSGMLASEQHELVAGGAPLEGKGAITHPVVVDESEGKVLDGISAEFGIEEHVALAGPAGGGKEHLALVLARQLPPNSGSVSLGGQDLAELPEAVTGRRTSYVGQDCYLFSLS